MLQIGNTVPMCAGRTGGPENAMAAIDLAREASGQTRISVLLCLQTLPKLLREVRSVTINQYFADHNHIHVGPQKTPDRFFRRSHDGLVLV